MITWTNGSDHDFAMVWNSTWTMLATSFRFKPTEPPSVAAESGCFIFPSRIAVIVGIRWFSLKISPIFWASQRRKHNNFFQFWQLQKLDPTSGTKMNSQGNTTTTPMPSTLCCQAVPTCFAMTPLAKLLLLGLQSSSSWPLAVSL